MAWWNVHDQIGDAALGDSLQVVANRADVHAIDERRLRLEDVPGLLDEFMQPSSRLLRLQAQAAECRPARNGVDLLELFVGELGVVNSSSSTS